MRVYVLGDFGLDNYLMGKPRGLSAEVPIPVVTITDKHALPAMAGNVLANLEALGIEAYGIRTADAHNSVGGPCPVKNRLFAGDVQLARWDEADVCKPYTVSDLAELRHADAVIVADYGKGSITPRIVEVLVNATVPLFIDTKQDPTPWAAAATAVLFPNSAEYAQFKEQYGFQQRVLLKQGREGMTYMEYGKPLVHIESLAEFVQCVNGAGDTVLAAFVVGTLAGFPLPQVMQFAAAAAANVVEQPPLERTTDTDTVIARLEYTYEGSNAEIPLEHGPDDTGDARPRLLQLPPVAGTGKPGADAGPGGAGSPYAAKPLTDWGRYFRIDPDEPVN